MIQIITIPAQSGEGLHPCDRAALGVQSHSVLHWHIYVLF
jgi:hypothetical protein